MSEYSVPNPALNDNCPVPAGGRALRPFLIAFGFVCVGFGAVGVVVPGLPTTIFLIVAAWAFARSSRRFHAWLYGQRTFGPMLRNWDEHRVIPNHAKILAVVSMTASFLFVTLFVATSWIFPALLLAVMVPSSFYILTRSSRAPDPQLAKPKTGLDSAVIQR